MKEWSLMLNIIVNELNYACPLNFHVTDLFSKFYILHNRALNGQFNLHNKANKCTYVQSIYHRLFITGMFQLLSWSSSG
jgi:hypothetical protein